MTIIRTAQTSNYTILNNAIANDESLSGTATAILLYLVTKPPHWNFNAKDIKRRFGIGLNKVYRCMRELIAAGYAMYKRTQSACEWIIFDTKQTGQPATAPAVTDRVNFERVKNECVLERTDKAEITKTQQPAAPTPTTVEPEVKEQVVVSSDELIYPSQLTPVQKKAAKAVIKKVKAPELRQEVLFALAYAIASGTVKSPVAYLNGLVSRCNDGTFESVTSKSPGNKPIIPIWQGRGTSVPSNPETATGFIQQARAVLKGALKT